MIVKIGNVQCDVQLGWSKEHKCLPEKTAKREAYDWVGIALHGRVTTRTGPTQPRNLPEGAYLRLQTPWMVGQSLVEKFPRSNDVAS
jgi:hypothetical protein